MFYLHALVTKSLPEKLKNVLSVAVRAVNYIRENALNHCLKLCNEVGAKHSVLLYHPEVRCLFPGRVLSRVFELRNRIKMFLRQLGSSLEVHIESEDLI